MGCLDLHALVTCRLTEELKRKMMYFKNSRMGSKKVGDGQPVAQRKTGMGSNPKMRDSKMTWRIGNLLLHLPSLEVLQVVDQRWGTLIVTLVHLPLRPIHTRMGKIRKLRRRNRNLKNGILEVCSYLLGLMRRGV